MVFANPAFCQMHGYALSEVIGEKFYTFIDMQSRPKVIQMYQKSVAKKSAPPRTFEYLRLTKDGKSYPTEILAKITYYENKLSSIGICRDITQRVKLEHKIRESERMAYIGQVTTSLSREIRNPLSSVQMNLQILKKHPQLKGPDECIQNIFEPFFTTKSKGTGLGLNNVKRIVRAHNGRIEFANLDPCGAVFRILLQSGY